MSSPPGRRHRRWCQRGQSITEFALVFPVAVVILAVAATGGEMVMTDIGLTQAARAGAIAAAHDAAAGRSLLVQTTDAGTAANNEQGGPGSIQCSGGGPSGCVQVVDMTAPGPGLENRVVSLVQVRLWETVIPFVPIFGNVTIQAEATAPQ
ncbi:MAG: TadE/TadG family type IV pilus assembly protein [Candidatus Dormibacteria bacterium]